VKVSQSPGTTRYRRDFHMVGRDTPSGLEHFLMSCVVKVGTYKLIDLYYFSICKCISIHTAITKI